MNTKTPHPKKFFHENRFYYLSLVVAAAILLILLLWPHTAKSGKTFGMCLKEKGVVMYGSDLCEICQQQKKYFGEDFQNVKYVNCDIYFDLCEARSIRSYPVWAFGEKYLKGIKTLSELSDLSGCNLTGK